MDVTFQTSDGTLYPLGGQATLVAENLRLFAAGKFPDDAALVEREQPATRSRERHVGGLLGVLSVCSNAPVRVAMA